MTGPFGMGAAAFRREPRCGGGWRPLCALWRSLHAVSVGRSSVVVASSAGAELQASAARPSSQRAAAYGPASFTSRQAVRLGEISTQAPSTRGVAKVNCFQRMY
eukprot:COSAG01_NODE_35879_length_525_cov_1.091549_1_plen_104_part_00